MKKELSIVKKRVVYKLSSDKYVNKKNITYTSGASMTCTM